MGRLLHLAHQGYRRIHPPWVEEGIAARCEPAFMRLHYIDLVADRFRSGESSPFTRLLAGAAITGEEDRARAFVMVQYLIEQRGLEHFTLAIDDLMRHPSRRFLRTRYQMRTLQELQNRLRDWTLHRSPIRVPILPPDAPEDR